MAVTSEARRLTEQHRQAQMRLAALTVARVRGLMPLLTPESLGVNAEAFVDATVALIARQHGISIGLARAYFRAFRLSEIGRAPAGTLPTPGIDLDRIRTSVTVTGPVKVKQGIAKGRTFDQAARIALASAAGAASRHVLDGGRQMLTGAVRADRQAVGYARATSGNPCAFCALLAGRGPVFKNESFELADLQFTGDGDMKVHDNCGCTLEPVYSRDAPFPGQRYADLYNDAAKGTQDPLNSFRRAYEGG